MNRAVVGTAMVLLFMGWTVAYAGRTRPAAFALHAPPVLEIPALHGSGDSASDTLPPVAPDEKGRPFPLRPDGPFFDLLIPDNRMVTDNLNDHNFAYEGRSYAMRRSPGGIGTITGRCSSSRDVAGIYVNASGVDVFFAHPGHRLTGSGGDSSEQSRNGSGHLDATHTNGIAPLLRFITSSEQPELQLFGTARTFD